MWLIRIFLAFVLAIPGVVMSADPFKFPTPVISIPFDAHKAGTKVEVYFRIEETFFRRLLWGFDRNRRGTYAFRTGYLFNNDKTNKSDYKRVKRLAEFVSIKMKLRLYKITSYSSELIFEIESREQIEDGLWYPKKNLGCFTKKINQISLIEGNYRVVIETLDDVERLSGTPVVFDIGYAHGK